MSEPNGSSPELSAIEETLRAEIGLDPATVGSSLVSRAVLRRMEKRGLQSMTTYASRLLEDARELQDLVEEVIVPETYFFREFDAIAAVTARALAATSTNADSFRVLSVPCSTGEEPYSIAIAMLMAGVRSDAIAIDAMDVSHEAVRRATLGEFRDGSFRGEAGGWKGFFEKSSRGWEIDSSVRALVRAQHGNLVAESFRPPRQQYDAIFCRNLFIYFDAESQSRALRNLAPFLAPDGVLAVGAADAFALRRAGYEPLPGQERTFLFRRSLSPVSTDMPLAAPAGVRPRARVSHTPESRYRQSSQKEPPRRANAVARATAFVARASLPQPSAQGEVLRLSNEGRFADALTAGERIIRDGDVSAGLLSLMGILHAALSDLHSAEACYRRALFLNPADEDALLHLSLLLQQRGETVLAERLLSRARRSFDTRVPAAT
ncbi:MAG: CheR family methyltransferase [Gemmatimonadaceae bacterium]